MSASLLRQAAALIRERAEAATYVYAPHHPRAGEVVPWFEGGDVYSFDETDGPHIMAWSPAVALAVADWLDNVAKTWWAGKSAEEIDALTVARLYLGRDS